MFIILVCGSQLCHGEKLNCKFEDLGYYGVGSLFSCAVTSLANLHNNVTIDGHSRVYMTNKNDADVKAIYIENTNTKYIPTNLGSLFNLTALRMVRSQLVEIKATDFHGMQDLEHLNFYDNNLSSVPLDVFTTLTKLRIIILGSNQIEELSNGIFKNNLDMEEIHLWDNKIKYLGTEMFNDLKKLNWVVLYDNICINEFYKGKTEIIQLKDDIKMKCKNPNENPATTTTTTTQNSTTTSTAQTPATTTAQNPMNADFIEFKKSLSNFFDNLFTELRAANEKLKNHTML